MVFPFNDLQVVRTPLPRTLLGWTETGNVPSAKITHLREAVGYLSQLPEEMVRILAVRCATHERRTESLGEYFVRLNDMILGSTLVLEFDQGGAIKVLHGTLDALN